MRRLRLCWRPRTDEGMVTAFVVISAVTLLFVAGLVFEGGRMLATKREILNTAQSAARAGAQAIDDQALRNGAAVILDPQGAHTRACDLLARAGYACGDNATVAPDGNRVTVTVTGTLHVTMLPPGVADPTFTLTARACVAQGITGAEATAHC